MKCRNLDIDGEEIVNAFIELQCDKFQDHLIKIRNAYVNRKSLNVAWIVACFNLRDLELVINLLMRLRVTCHEFMPTSHARDV